MAENWIEKVIESLKSAKFLFQSKYTEGYDELWERDTPFLRKVLNDYAPVIDALKLAEKIVLHQQKVGILETYHERALEGVREDIAQLITSSIEAQGIKVKK